MPRRAGEEQGDADLFEFHLFEGSFVSAMTFRSRERSENSPSWELHAQIIPEVHQSAFRSSVGCSALGASQDILPFNTPDKLTRHPFQPVTVPHELERIHRDALLARNRRLLQSHPRIQSQRSNPHNGRLLMQSITHVDLTERCSRFTFDLYVYRNVQVSERAGRRVWRPRGRMHQRTIPSLPSPNLMVKLICSHRPTVSRVHRASE